MEGLTFRTNFFPRTCVEIQGESPPMGWMGWTGVMLVLLFLAVLFRAQEVHAEKPGFKRGVVSQAISLLEQNYVTPGEADTLGLLQGALVDAGREFPSLSFRLNPPGHPGKVKIRAGGREVLIPASESKGIHELRTILLRVEAFISASVRNGSPEKIGGVLVKGMLRSLDPYSALLSPAVYDLQRVGGSSGLGRFGLRLKSIHGLLTVTAAHPDSSAGKAGVLPGDRVFQIEDTPSAHLEAGAAASLIQGKSGSRVRILVMRPNQPEPLSFVIRGRKSTSLSRGGISSHVFKEKNGRRIGYLKVTSFQENTPPALRKHFQRLRSDLPGMVGLVLDLRGNPGGYLEGALQVADQFLSRGTIVTMRGASGESKVIRARWYRGVTSLPLVVLADRRTASSAEIVAGALRFNNRGLLIGETTFGKHSIQSIFPLTGGSALKLTVATFQTGSAGAHGSTGGIVPHVMLVPVQRAVEEGAYGGILASLPLESQSEQQSTAAGKPLIRLPYALKGTAAPRGILASNSETYPNRPKSYWSDYALGLARRLLNGNHPGDQASLLRGAGFFLRREKKRQEEWIQEMLADRGIDWSRGSAENTGAMKLVRAEIHTRDGAGNPWRLPNRGMHAEEEMRLGFTIRNLASTSVHRVTLAVRSPADFLDGLEIPVGKMSPFQTRKVNLALKIPHGLPQGLEELTLRIFDGRRDMRGRSTHYLPLIPTPQPVLKARMTILDNGRDGSKGNGDGRLQPGETLSLHVRVENKGKGHSGKGGYWLGSSTDERLVLKKPLHHFPSLAPGGSASGNLLFTVRKSASSRPIHLTWRMQGDSPRMPLLRYPIRLRINQGWKAKTLQMPIIHVRLPSGAIREDTLSLAGSVRDGRGVRDLQVFLENNKIHYGKTPGNPPGPHPFSVDLRPANGRNKVRVIARNLDGLTSSRTFLIWRNQPAGIPFAGARKDGYFPGVK